MKIFRRVFAKRERNQQLVVTVTRKRNPEMYLWLVSLVLFVAIVFFYVGTRVIFEG